jgi:hypothetical protein
MTVRKNAGGAKTARVSNVKSAEAGVSAVSYFFRTIV